MTIRESTVPSNNPVFKFNRETYSVRVDSISENASRQDIVDLFQNFIGQVRRCEECVEVGKSRSMELTFFSRDAYMKALCMTGYTVAGVALTVTPSAMPSPRFAGSNKQSDNRRNLYVLGLPFDLTKLEFMDIFSHYGKVSHAVILATIDNASRRRGFVVMSTHAEARLAMSSLSRTEIKGHQIDVSWAVVQRSQGFLDGGDRTVAIPPPVSSPAPAKADDVVPAENSGFSSSLSRSKQIDCLIASTAVTPTLLIMNLPSLLFSQPSDLQPLLFPFGQITELKILNSSSDISGYINVAVEYSTPDSAYEAKMTLDGQVYVNHVIKVEFIQSFSPSGRDDAPPMQMNHSDLSCQNQPPNPLSSAFTFNSQRIPGYNEGYLSKAGNPLLPPPLAVSNYTPASIAHTPYAYTARSAIISPPDLPATWSNNNYAQASQFSDQQCSSLVIGAPALPVFYPSRIV